TESKNTKTVTISQESKGDELSHKSFFRSPTPFLDRFDPKKGSVRKSRSRSRSRNRSRSSSPLLHKKDHKSRSKSPQKETKMQNKVTNESDIFPIPVSIL